MGKSGTQLSFQLENAYKFKISRVDCPHCCEPITGSGRKSLHTFELVYLSMRAAAIELRFKLKLSSVRYAEVLLFCHHFESFNSMTRALFGKYNAANAEIKQMHTLVTDGYIERYGRAGKRSTFRLTIKGRTAVDEVLRRHKLI